MTDKENKISIPAGAILYGNLEKQEDGSYLFVTENHGSFPTVIITQPAQHESEKLYTPSKKITSGKL